MRKLTLLLMLVLGGLWATAQKTYVVAVGINDYINPTTHDLNCCENDARSFANIMKTQRAEVYTLLSARATKASIMKAFMTVSMKAKAEDAVIFFFSGHGFQGGFCPADFKTGDKPWMTGLFHDDIKKAFKMCRATRKMVFADACYSGGIRNPGKKIKPLKKNENFLLFLSSRDDETSIEQSFFGSGVYTRYLIQALEGKADTNNDHIVTARELFDYVHDGVGRSTNGAQNPVMWGKFDNNMIVTRW